MTDEDENSISPVGRELLKYLRHRIVELGINQAQYRQARVELMQQIEEGKGKRRSFNWGFEAIFTDEVHTLETLGLVAVKYGSGAIMAGRSNPNQIYSFSLTDDGIETANVIAERENRNKPPEPEPAPETDVMESAPETDSTVDESTRLPTSEERDATDGESSDEEE